MIASLSSSSSSSSSSTSSSGLGLGFGGFGRSHVRSEQNHVYFYTEVDRENVRVLGEVLRETERYCLEQTHRLKLKKKLPIYLHINSFGGCLFSGFTAVDYIRSLSVPVYSVIEGSAASAATLMSVSCKRRYIAPNAHMLIHQLSSGCWGKYVEIEDEYTNLKQFMVKIKQIYKDRTTIPPRELKRLLKHDLWLNSAQAIEYGLVDRVYE
jgi:ATP-dependent protease ClpP protease subunit